MPSRSFKLALSGQKRIAMRIAYFDCFSGISGDMFLGALVDEARPRICWKKRLRR